MSETERAAIIGHLQAGQTEKSVAKRFARSQQVIGGIRRAAGLPSDGDKRWSRPPKLYHRRLLMGVDYPDRSTVVVVVPADAKLDFYAGRTWQNALLP